MKPAALRAFMAREYRRHQEGALTPDEAAYLAAREALRAHEAKREQLATAARKAAAKLSRYQLLKLESRKP
jgi:hypothetical protein